MKKIIYLLSFLSLFLMLDTKASETEFSELLNKIRNNFTQKNMFKEIVQLEQEIKKNNIDISRYGLGRGVIPFWKEKTLEVAQKELQLSCKNKTLSRQSTSLNSIKFKNSEFVTFNDIHKEEQLSILTPKTVQDLFQLLASKESDIVYSEYGNGCESRAHAMAQIMDKLCIDSGKAFIQSEKIQVADYSWWWLYHVAPIVLVEEEGIKTAYIIDPSLFKQAVPLTSWIEKLRARNYYNQYDLKITSRYTLMPWDASKKLQSYQEIDLDEVESRLRKRKLIRLIRPFIGEIKSL